MPIQRSRSTRCWQAARVYFVGHPVAVAVAVDRYTARDALDLIEADYDPLPVVSDPEKALEKDSPLTHPEFGTNVAFTWSVANGDLDAAFKRADKIIKQRMIHQRLIPMAIEPRGCLASWHAGEGSLTLHTSTQIPHLIRTLLPGMIAVPENKIRIVAPEVAAASAPNSISTRRGADEPLGDPPWRACKVDRITTRKRSATIHGRDRSANTRSR